MPRCRPWAHLHSRLRLCRKQEVAPLFLHSRPPLDVLGPIYDPTIHRMEHQADERHILKPHIAATNWPTNQPAGPKRYSSGESPPATAANNDTPCYEASSFDEAPPPSSGQAPIKAENHEEDDRGELLKKVTCFVSSRKAADFCKEMIP